jgi:hypothetical protein
MGKETGKFILKNQLKRNATEYTCVSLDINEQNGISSWKKSRKVFFVVVVVVVAHLLELAELLTDPIKNWIPSPLDVISI